MLMHFRLLLLLKTVILLLFLLGLDDSAKGLSFDNAMVLKGDTKCVEILKFGDRKTISKIQIDAMEEN